MARPTFVLYGKTKDMNFGHDPQTVICCAGEQVAYFRKRKGMTQKDLAKKSGYSERLVRKAEGSGPLKWLTINDLASALCDDDTVVSPEDLVCSPETMARQMLAAYAEHEAEWVSHIGHLIDEEAVLRCAGDPKKIPFAGEWYGPEGFDQWARIFFATLTRPEKDFYKPDYLASGNTVVAWGEEWAHVAGVPTPPLWVTQRFVFRRGKLILFEDLFDTDRGSAHLAEARARGLLEEPVSS